jgi:hypothetical protein
MNSILLVLLASFPPGGDPAYLQAPVPAAAYPDAGAASGNSSHQGRPRLFGWLRGHHHNKCPCAGNGHADGNQPPVASIPAPPVGTGTVVEAMAPEPVPALITPPAPAEPAPRLVGRPQTVITSAEPPLADTPASAGPAPRLVPIPAR